MIDDGLLAYFAFTTLLVMTPGSVTAVVVRNVLAGGARQGMAAALGAAAGNTSYAVVTALGAAALFARSPAAFVLLRSIGTAYLLFLGVRSLRAAWGRRPEVLPGALEPHGSGAAPSRRMGFAQGFVTNLANPAIATFYLAVLPSFLHQGRTWSGRFALMAVVHVVMAFAFHTAWVVALDAMRAFWSRPAARRALETLTGAALLTLAARVAGVI